MAHVISRIFANQTDADAAYQDLSDYGFQPDEIFTVDARPAADGAAVSAHEIADRIARCFIPKHHAAAYAEHVARGGVFVSVHAPFTAGRKAAAALDRNNPVDTQAIRTGAPAKPLRRYDEATPLSSALFLPVRLDNPAPLSTLAGLPALVSSAPRLLSEPAPLSSSMGWPVASADPTPASTATGAPTLASSSSMFSNLLGLGTLWRSAAPLSRALFLPVLSRSGKPMSLGLPLLWR